MHAALASGEYDCVATRRVSRKGEPAIRSFFARRFYALMSKISDAHIVDGARDFRLMTRQMTDAILSLRECNRFSKGIFSWVGFRTKWLEFENAKRVAGETKWSFWGLVLYSLEGITAFSTVPLVFASVAGMLSCLVSFVFVCVLVVKTLVWGDPVSGYPSLMSVVLFIGGIQLFAIGILGQYLAKTYLETKKRPIYIVREKSE
jgi:glycosyltransferase involved in cell wall biosynthesis